MGMGCKSPTVPQRLKSETTQARPRAGNMKVESATQHNLKNWALPTLTESPAFPLAELRSVSREGLFKHITTYLGEYRFNQAIDTYGLVYENGHLRGEHETKPLLHQIEDCILRNRAMWRKTNREEADREGAISLERQLADAKEGDFILWGSPPEPGSEDYGDHGYLYLGRVAGKRIDMHSFRIDSKNLQDYNGAISRLTGQNINHTTPEDFISQPLVFKEFAEADVLKVLKETCNFSQAEYEDAAIARTLEILQPYIHGFIGLVQGGESKDVLEHAFAAVEKHAIDVWASVRLAYEGRFSTNHDLDDLARMSFYSVVDKYDGSPLPMAGGSCGPACSTNIFGKNSPLADLLNLSMPCPVCEETIVAGSESCSSCKTSRVKYLENPEKAKADFVRA